MLVTEQWPIDRLIPYAKNPRHNDSVVPQMMAAIQEFGFRIPIVAKSDGTVIDGHLRLKAAINLGFKDVPVALADELTDAQVKAFRLLANQSANWAEWDNALLSLELDELADMDFDLSLTGFSDDELAELMEKAEEGLGDSSDEELDDPDESIPPVSVSGDIWLLGEHRLMCGDSTSITDIDLLLDGESVDMVLTDPPYGISIVNGGWVGGGEANKIPFGGVKNETESQRKKRLGSIGSANKVKIGRYAPVAGDDTINVAVAAISIIKTLCAKVEIIWGGNYYASYLDNSSCWIVWDKQNTGDFADCELAWTNQKTAVRMFSHMWNGMIKASEHGQKRIHPTQKPVALAQWCISNYGQDCRTVLDLFGGSGFTLMACENTGKQAFIVELSPHYVDAMINRWQKQTGRVAVHAVTGEEFEYQH